MIMEGTFIHPFQTLQFAVNWFGFVAHCFQEVKVLGHISLNIYIAKKTVEVLTFEPLILLCLKVSQKCLKIRPCLETWFFAFQTLFILYTIKIKTGSYSLDGATGFAKSQECLMRQMEGFSIWYALLLSVWLSNFVQFVLKMPFLIEELWIYLKKSKAKLLHLVYGNYVNCFVFWC